MRKIHDELSLDDLSTVCGGFKPPKGAVPFPGGGWEQDRSHKGDLQVRWISPDGKKGKWRSAGPD
jgi:hypothetical protein